MENGRQITAKVHQLSVTGGLLSVEAPLDEGIKVEVMFHLGETTLRARASTLFPVWATKGYLQPFEFAELESSLQESLQADLARLLGIGRS
jgi:hypothetical protein